MLPDWPKSWRIFVTGAALLALGMLGAALLLFLSRPPGHLTEEQFRRMQAEQKSQEAEQHGRNAVLLGGMAIWEGWRWKRDSKRAKELAQ